MADVIARLKVDSREYDAKIERARSGLIRLEESLRKAGGTMADASKDQVEFVRSLGHMDTVAKTARGKIAELSKAFVDLKLQYNGLSDAEKQSAIGQALAQSLETLKGRVADMKGALADASAELGETGAKSADLSGLMSTLGAKFGINGDMLKALTTGTIGYAAAITGLTTATIAASKAFADYNSKLNQQQSVTTVTTGLKGPEADRMTAGARSMADVYDVDFREVINAANTLMTQFGRSGEEAMMLIRDGMQGMIMGDGPKLLSMIQQFAPSFRDAGISASQLVAIIHNSEGGIFTDENMSAIVMGIRNIRLMTEQTSQALKGVGIDGEEMKKKLADGSMTIFDALKQVSVAIDKTGGSSQAAGQVMQTVFGRQATIAGSKLGEAIATLNTNLTETKNQTGELGGAYAQLQQANEKFERAMMETFGYDGWTVMATSIKSDLVVALTDVLTLVNDIKNSWVGEIGSTIFDAIINKIQLGIDLLKVAWAWQKKLLGIGSAGGTGSEAGATGGSVMGDALGKAAAKATPEPKDPEEPKEPKNKTKPTLVEGGLNIKTVKAAEVGLQGMTETLAELRAAQQKYKAAMDNATTLLSYQEAKEGYERAGSAIDMRQHALRLGVSTEDLTAVEDQMKEWMEETKGKLKPIEIKAEVDTSGTDEAAKLMNGEWQKAAGAVQSLGSALQGLEDPAAKVMGIVAQAIATVALSFAKSLTQEFGTWDWIAAAVAGTATMISTITAIKSATAGSYAEGGIVPGNSYSGDLLTANVNSGELILSKSQQNNIAALLTEPRGSYGGSNSQPYVSGEQIFLGLNNYLRRSNRGELLTTKH